MTTAGGLSIDVRELADWVDGLESPDGMAASLQHYVRELLPGVYEDWVVRGCNYQAATYERKLA